MNALVVAAAFVVPKLDRDMRRRQEEEKADQLAQDVAKLCAAAMEDYEETSRVIDEFWRYLNSSHDYFRHSPRAAEPLRDVKITVRTLNLYAARGEIEPRMMFAVVSTIECLDTLVEIISPLLAYDGVDLNEDGSYTLPEIRDAYRKAYFRIHDQEAKFAWAKAQIELTKSTPSHFSRPPDASVLRDEGPRVWDIAVEAVAMFNRDRRRHRPGPVYITPSDDASATTEPMRFDAKSSITDIDRGPSA